MKNKKVSVKSRDSRMSHKINTLPQLVDNLELHSKLDQSLLLSRLTRAHSNSTHLVLSPRDVVRNSTTVSSLSDTEMMPDKNTSS